MVRAAGRPALAARTAVVLLLGVSLAGCSAAGAPGAGHVQHDAATASGTAPVVAGAEESSTTAPAPDDAHAHEGEDGADDAAVTAGPPRPAEEGLECGLTVLETGEQVIRYCDEGHATVAVDSADTDVDLAVDGARCEDRGAFFLAHFGASYSDEATARGEYVGLVLEDMPAAGDGAPRVSALEFTLEGHRQTVTEAAVEVSREGDEVTFDLVGTLAGGEPFTVAAHCAVAEG